MAKMNKITLYNDKGELCAEARPLLHTRPQNISKLSWKNNMQSFEKLLSIEDLKEFRRLRARTADTKYRAKYFIKNREKVLKYHYEYNAKNPEKKKKADAKWHAKQTKKRHADARARRYKRRMATDPKYVIITKLRAAIRQSFKRIGKNKPTDTLTLLGCSWEEAKAHIEHLWQEGMSWETHGPTGWHIDHIRPVSSFKEDELHSMNHISNLQPLWATDNLSKSDKWV